LRFLCLAFIGFSIFMSGCTTRVTVPVTKPAIIDLTGINKIAISRISGNAGAEFSDTLTLKLMDSKKYDVVDKTNMDKVFFDNKLSEHNIIDANTAAKLKKFMGTAAIIYGNLTFKYELQKSKGNAYTDRNGDVHRPHYKQADGSLTGKLQIRESNKGSMITELDIQKNLRENVQSDNEWPDDPDKDAMKSRAIEIIASDFMKWVAPYTEYEAATFEHDSKIPELEQCAKSAVSGNWPDAVRLAKKATEINPSNADAWWNLGLSYKYSQLFDEAENAFNQGYKLSNKAKFLAQLESLKKFKYDKNRLEAQDNSDKFEEPKKEVNPLPPNPLNNNTNVKTPNNLVTSQKTDVRKTPTTSTSMTVIGSKVKLRKSPSSKSTSIKTLKKGEEVQVIKQKDDWCLIELVSGETGWCQKVSLTQSN